MSEPTTNLRIRVTAWVGSALTLGSLTGILWLLDVFAHDNYPTPYSIAVKELACPVALEFNFGFTLEYGEPNPNGPERSGDGTLVTVTITPLDKPILPQNFPKLGCEFEVTSSARILSALVSTTTGDERSPELTTPENSASNRWGLRLDPETFAGYFWLYVDDISLARTFEDRMGRMSATFVSKTKGILYQSDEDPEPHRLHASITLPTESQVKSFAPYDMRIRGIGIYASDPIELIEHEWRYGIAVTYANPERAQWYQVLLIAFSTLFGVGVSAVIESFLAGGVITLHRRLLEEVIDEPKQVPKSDSAAGSHLVEEPGSREDIQRPTETEISIDVPSTTKQPEE